MKLVHSFKCNSKKEEKLFYSNCAIVKLVRRKIKAKKMLIKSFFNNFFALSEFKLNLFTSPSKNNVKLAKNVEISKHYVMFGDRSDEADDDNANKVSRKALQTNLLLQVQTFAILKWEGFILSQQNDDACEIENFN